MPDAAGVRFSEAALPAEEAEGGGEGVALLPTQYALVPLVVRAECDLTSAKLTDIASGTELVVLCSQDGEGGARRALVRISTPTGYAEGWVTSVSKEGVGNLSSSRPSNVPTAAVVLPEIGAPDRGVQ